MAAQPSGRSARLRQGQSGERLGRSPFFATAGWLWLLPAALVVALLMRFGMRAVGVRPDIAFPGLIYRLTLPVVEPFYRYFPVSPRFDQSALEAASLAAAAAVLGAALVVCTLWLLVSGWLSSRPARS